MEEGALVRALGGRLDEIVFVTDLGVKMLWANARLTEETGYRSDDFAFVPRENPFIHPDDVARVAETITRFVASGADVSEEISNRFFTRWGEVLVCRSTMFRIAWQGEPALLFVLRADPHPSLGSIEAQSFRRIVEEAHDGIVKISGDGRVHYANGRFRQIVELAPVDLAKSSFFDLVVPEERAAVREAIERVATAPGTFDAHLTDGARAPIAVTVSASRLVGQSDGDLTLLLVRDVTEERRVAGALQEAQKLESIGVLVAGVAHDFNNIATSMRASVSVAERLAPPEGRLSEVLRDLDAAGQRAAEITSSLLAYAGKAPSKRESVELVDVVRRSMRLLRAFVSPTIELTVVAPKERLVIEGDARQLGQVLVNLVTNGAEAIGTNAGEIRIDVRAVDIDELPASGERWFPVRPPPGRYIALAVRDDGRGMSTATMDRFADLFFTTKSRGHGLGLPATVGIVRLHGGAVRVSSVEGKGSVVEAFFPRTEAMPRNALRESDANLGGIERGGPLLLVEDESSLRKLGTWILQDAGFEVESAADGMTGLALFAANPSRFRAVIVDEHMPGMPGRTLLHHVRALRRDIPIVLTSGYLESAPEEECVFLPKPYDGDALERAVLRALGQKRT